VALLGEVAVHIGTELFHGTDRSFACDGTWLKHDPYRRVSLVPRLGKTNTDHKLAK